jgi:threonylcarbamoyladenosine tRNA methylthiotransferase MtaB
VPTAAFTTLGCKVNQYETQKILESFEEAGFQVVPFEGPADVYVINTCSVTSQAESKSRYTIRRASRFNPEAKVVVTGCASQMAANKGEGVDGADVVVPNPEKLEALRYFLRAFPELLVSTPLPPSFHDQSGSSTFTNQNEEGETLPPPPASSPSGDGEGIARRHRTRATLKIQDGCSVFCSYCSIPFTRPVMSSRPHEEVLDEARRMAEMGYKEIILTGVLIGAYGPDTGSGGPCFEDLVESLADELGPDVRIRISSIEMRQVTPRLIELIKAAKVVPHLHIPLQAGDTGVLKDMNRPYTQDDYLRLCETLYRTVPDISITTDIMVGFPTETEERFASTVHVCNEAKYLKAHLFRFSPRYGTPADTWGDPVEPQEKQRRSLVLNDVTRRTGEEHIRRFLWQTMRVLVEGKIGKDGLLQGLTDNYLEVKFAGSPSLARQFAWVRLDEARDGVAYGELAGKPSDLRLRVLAGN